MTKKLPQQLQPQLLKLITATGEDGSAFMSDAPKKPDAKDAAPPAPAVPGAKLKPPPFTQEQLAEQILALRTQEKISLQLQLRK